jgi:U3 small nucleolar RNA-associated protein 14
VSEVLREPSDKSSDSEPPSSSEEEKSDPDPDPDPEESESHATSGNMMMSVMTSGSNARHRSSLGEIGTAEISAIVLVPAGALLEKKPGERGNLFHPPFSFLP